jgi:hypothetical protein
MNRYDTPLKYDYSFNKYMPEFFTPNFQAWGQVMANEEQQDDLTKALSERMPVYIPKGKITDVDANGNMIETEFGDQASFDAYRSNVAKLEAELEATAQTGNMAAYREKRKEVMRRLNKDWQPGGHAATLETRYKSYVDGLKKLKEQGEKSSEWGSVNRTFAQNQFYKSVGRHDPQRQEYQGVGDPEPYPYLDVQKEITAFAKELGYNDVKIEHRDGKWVVTEHDKYVPKENREKLEAYLENPKFSQQYQIEAYNRLQNTDPVGMKVAMDKENAKFDVLQKENDEIHDLSLQEVMSREELLKVQQGLKNRGYNVTVDGVLGEETRAALRQFNTTYNPNMFQNMKYQNLGQFVGEKTKQEYGTIATGVFNNLRHEEKDYDALWMTNYKNGLERENIQLEHSLYTPEEQNIIGYTGNETVTPQDQSVRTEDAKKLLQNTADKTKMDYVALYGKEAVDGKGIDNIDKIVEAAWAAAGPEQNYEAFSKYLKNNGITENTQGGHGAIYREVQSGNFAKSVEARRNAEVTYRNETAINIGMDKDAYDKWLTSGSGEKWLRSQGYVAEGGYDPESLFDQLFDPDAKLNPKDATKKRRIKEEMERGKFYEGVKPKAQPYTTWVPGNNTKTSGVYKQIGDVVKNPATLSISPTFVDKLGNLKIKDYKEPVVKSVAQSNNGTLFAAVEIKHGEDFKKTSVIFVPFDEIMSNGTEQWAKAMNEDVLSNKGKQDESDASYMFAGKGNFSRVTGTPVLNQITAENTVRNMRLGGQKDISNFSVNQNGSRYNYKIVATKGSQSPVYSIQKQVGPYTYEPIESLTNYENVEHLQAAFAMKYSGINPERKEIVDERPRKEDMIETGK